MITQSNNPEDRVREFIEHLKDDHDVDLNSYEE